MMCDNFGLFLTYVIVILFYVFNCIYDFDMCACVCVSVVVRVSVCECVFFFLVLYSFISIYLVIVLLPMIFGELKFILHFL